MRKIRETLFRILLGAAVTVAPAWLRAELGKTIEMGNQERSRRLMEDCVRPRTAR